MRSSSAQTDTPGEINLHQSIHVWSLISYAQKIVKMDEDDGTERRKQTPTFRCILGNVVIWVVVFNPRFSRNLCPTGGVTVIQTGEQTPPTGHNAALVRFNPNQKGQKLKYR